LAVGVKGEKWFVTGWRCALPNTSVPSTEAVTDSQQEEWHASQEEEGAEAEGR
jgi:hypothetical protein